MGINFNHFMDHLNKEENIELKQAIDKISKNNKQTQEKIFKILSERNYRTDFERITKEYYHWKETTREYKDWFFAIAIKNIKEACNRKIFRYEEQDVIRTLTEQIQALKDALDTTRPQSLPEFWTYWWQQGKEREVDEEKQEK